MQIFSKIKTPIYSLLNSLKSEAEINCEITYRVNQGQILVDGRPEDQYKDVNITVLKLRHNAETLKLVKTSQDSPLQVGDIIYLIDGRDFPKNTSLKDKIIRDGIVEQIKDITPVFDMLYVVTVEST